MAFVKKTWKNRQSEYPNRRRLTDESGNSQLYMIFREEGAIAEEGDAFSAENMNDLETRVAEALTAIKEAFSIDGTVVTIDFDKLSGVI